MKKVALCLHGRFGNSENESAGIHGYKYLKSLLLDRYDVDTYIHTWKPENGDFNHDTWLEEAYKPESLIVEKPLSFENELSNLDENYFNEGFDRPNTMYRNCNLHSTLSFLYSRKKAIESINKNYSRVLVSRLDANQRGGQEVREIRFDLDSPRMDDPDFIYSSIWPQLNSGYADMWFHSGLDNIQELAKAYDIAINDAFKKGSDYENWMTTGWPDSNEFNNDDVRDYRQFTNEVLKQPYYRSEKLMKYPKWQVINNHTFYKYFMIVSGLYYRSRWI